MVIDILHISAGKWSHAKNQNQTNNEATFSLLINRKKKRSKKERAKREKREKYC